MRNHDLADEILETLWTLIHERNSRFAYFDDQPKDRMQQAYARLVEEGKIASAGDGYVLTDAGEQIAVQLVRRHRLTERLFCDVLGFSAAEAHRVGCGFEHFLEDDATDAVCTFLGHPPCCPNGRPIPPGECCRKRTSRIAPLITSLYDMENGRKGKVMFIRTEDHAVSDRLMSLGIYPGQVVHLHQKVPSFLVQVDQTEIGLEAAVARSIFVRPTERNGA
jgi:DtxR family Mn-dependent transcriptional regulator